MHPFKKFADGRSGAAITVKVTPHAKQTEVAGILDDGTIKIHVTAPAEDGRANEALVAFLAETLGIAAGQIDIVAGLSAERKLISLTGVAPHEVDAKLHALTGPAKPAKAAAKPKGKPKPPAKKKK
jgi:hypothetical protein